MDIDADILKTQIKLSKELYQLPAYQNEGMKKRIEGYNNILEAIMADKFKTTTGDYKGSKTLAIKKEYVNKEGETKEGHVLTFGVGKAKAILAVLEEIKTFVEENDKDTQTVDLSKLSPEEQALVNSFITR